MRTVFDTAHLYRSSIGFDRMFDLLDSANQIESIDNWPPYDIIKTGDDTYRISMAVAGYSRDELNLVQEPNLLTVSGSKSGQSDGQYLYHGIAARSFQRRFELADHVKIVGAELRDGLLQIDLKRELPEEMKPRRIEISTDGDRRQLAFAPTRRIANQKHAA